MKMSDVDSRAQSGGDGPCFCKVAELIIEDVLVEVFAPGVDLNG